MRLPVCRVWLLVNGGAEGTKKHLQKYTGRRAYQPGLVMAERAGRGRQKGSVCPPCVGMRAGEPRRPQAELSHQQDPNGCSYSDSSNGGRCKRNLVAFRTPGIVLWIEIRGKELLI